MRRTIIAVILVITLVSVTPTSVNTPTKLSSPSSNLDITPNSAKLMADSVHFGSTVPAIQYMERMFSDQTLSISNSYALTNTHTNTIDLSSYQIPGWTLYKVILDSINMTATAEREVVGTSVAPVGGSFPYPYAIFEHGADLYYDQLAQGFYNLGHDGQLQNLSILYDSPTYDPGNQNNAYIDVRSNYQDGSTNMVSSVPLANVGLTSTWADVTEQTILDATTTYYVVLNGTKLVESGGFYPVIRWFFQNSAETFLTRRHNTDGDSWGADRPYEALLNYTYIPWNKTSSSALVYSNPSAINLTLDGTPVTGSSWTKSSVTNITSLQITTNQSVNVFHNLTLCYTQDITANTVWKANLSGAPIMWNVTTDLTYPVVPNIIAQSMNITNIPLDWTETGLYLGTSSGGSYSKTGSIVTCSGMSDGIWTLTSTAPNYVVDLSLSDSFDSSPIVDTAANLVVMDIDAGIEDGIGTPITGGTTNLSILQSGSLIFSPIEIPASGGLAAFQWNISSTTDGNGTHSVEVYWTSTNRLEAGYYSQEVFVFYSTTLVADEYNIVAFTENSFNIGIDFDQIYPVRGLDVSLAALTYSLGSIITNDTMDDAGGGRWTKTVSTATMSSGTYILTVYAEGFALENQSLTITIDLTIETQALNWSWSPSSVITYLESTNLTVPYRDSIGTNIPDAWVNVTIDSITYDLKWNGTSEVYWIQLNGTDFLTIPGTTIMTINAWKAGYTSQYNDSVAITINEESTGIGLIVNWNPIDRNISYIESITITVSYTYNSNPITDDTDLWPGASVYITFSGHPLENMVYNATSLLWEVTLDGSGYLGITTVTIRATATGYGLTSSIPVDMIVVEDIPILTNSWTDSAASTDYANDIDLAITVTDSRGSFINDAILSVNVFGTDYPMSFVADGEYELTIPINETKGIQVVNVTMVRVGYKTTTMLLDLTVRATTAIDVDYLSSEYEQWNLTVTVTYTDASDSSPITGATVTVTIDGVEYALTYDSGVYVREILLDFEPGTYTLTVVANAPFCNEAIALPSLDILAKRAVYLSLTTEGDPNIEGQLLSIIATLHYNDTDEPVSNVNIRFIVTIYFTNGTVEVRNNPLQYDTTNDVGAASWGFEIPSGNIEKISVQAQYLGSRQIWSTSYIYEVSVGANPLMLLLSFFFFTNVGRLLVGTILVLGIVVAAYNKKVKPKKRAVRASLENQLQMFRDLETLRHFMAVYLDRGTCVFYHPFTDERIEPDLISGFISAITSVYGEIKGDGVRGTLEEIQYHGLRLNSYSGQFVIGILILEGEMTTLLRERLEFFLELFENQYDHELTDWKGLVDCFDPEWVVSTLISAYNYSWLLAHKFGPTQKVAKIDAQILDYISAVRDDKDEFYIRKLLLPLAEMLDKTEAEVLDRLLHLQDKGMIVPVSIQTILQRQGMGLANGEIGADNITLEYPELGEPEVDEPEDSDEEMSSEAKVEPDEEPEDEKEALDSMDEFVKDVESLLTKEKDKEENE